MRRAILPAACCAVLAGGCGSSASSSAPAGSTRTSAPSHTQSGPHLTVDAPPSFGAPSPSAPVLSGLVTITYRYFTIDPDVIRVKVGATVLWRNTDPGPDNVTSVSGPQHLASGNLAEGATYRVRLTRPGVIHYLSTLHPATMNGTIQVLR
jgi:plastocyanin